jgi:hypothetical protein
LAERAAELLVARRVLVAGLDEVASPVEEAAGRVRVAAAPSASAASLPSAGAVVAEARRAALLRRRRRRRAAEVVGRSAGASDPVVAVAATEASGAIDRSPSGEGSAAADDAAAREALFVVVVLEPEALRDPAALEARVLGLVEVEPAEAAAPVSPEPSPEPEVSSDVVGPPSVEAAGPVPPLRPLPPLRRRRRLRAGVSPEAPSVWALAFVDGPASAGGAAIEVVNGSSLTCGPSLLGPRSARWVGRWSASASRPDSREMAE